MHVASAMSEHPLATRAVGECVGDLLERGGVNPDLLAIFMTAQHLGSVEDIVAAVHHLIGPKVLIGATAEAVMGGNRLVRGRPGLSMLALWSFDPVDAVAGVAIEPRWDARQAEGLIAFRATTGGVGKFQSSGAAYQDLDDLSGVLVVLADPFSYDADVLLRQIGDSNPDLDVVGGYASAANRSGGNLLILNEEIHRDGAVAVNLPGTLSIRTLSSAGQIGVGGGLTAEGIALNAEDELRAALHGCPALSGVLVFADANRHTLDHEDSNSDPVTISELTGVRNLAGLTCGREIVRLGGRYRTHDDAVSMLLFT